MQTASNSTYCCFACYKRERLESMYPRFGLEGQELEEQLAKDKADFPCDKAKTVNKIVAKCLADKVQHPNELPEFNDLKPELKTEVYNKWGAEVSGTVTI